MPAPTTDLDCILRLVRQYLMWNGGIEHVVFIATGIGVGANLVKRAVQHDKGEHVERVGGSVRSKEMDRR